MPSAVTSLRCLAMMYALTGLWIQPALPCWIDSLLLASDHDSTSGSMQSRNIFLYHSIVWAVAGELMFRDCMEPEVLRSEEHTSELQSRPHLVCRLLLEKKK